MNKAGVSAFSWQIPEVVVWLFLLGAVILLGWSVWKVAKILGL